MGRMNRGHWSLIEHPTKPPISHQEVIFFKKMMDKIMKVGMEFEYNLPEKKENSCDGHNDTCQCKHMVDKDCWKVCLLRKKCEADKRPEHCENMTENCKPESCATCKDFKLKCSNIMCSNFVSACLTCTNFEIDCVGCKHRDNLNNDPTKLRDNITKELAPNKNYGLINKSGVHSVKPDGSLLGDGGAEVITIGRRLDFWEFYNMADNVISTAKKNGAYVNERCSTHMHLLASYYGKLVPHGFGEQLGIPDHISEMEKDMPQIILANFHQLCRKYQNAMCWMGMGLDDPDRMTRWEKFRVSILEHSAVLLSMEKVRDAIVSTCPKDKYGFVNYVPVGFSRNGDINRFHIEMRGLDNLMSPSAVAAFACLYYSIVIKAIEISRYGILEMESKEWFEKARVMKNSILNNMKNYQDGDRFSDTRHVLDFQDDFIRESMEMISQLKHILLRIGPAFEILEKLAEKPCALRRINGDDWDKIENDLKVTMTEETIFEKTVDEIIDLRIVDKCNNINEWIDMVKETIFLEDNKNIDKEGIEERLSIYIDESMRAGELIWADKIGSVVKI